MKKLILLGALLLTLTACSAPKEAAETPIPPPAQAASPSPTTTATPEPEPADVVSETFTLSEYGQDETITVTVRYGRDNGPNTVTVEQDGAILQTITDEGGLYYSPKLTVEDMNFDGFLDFRYHYDTTVYHGLEHCYLWDREQKQFQLAEELEGLTDLSFDAETRTVKSFERSTAYGQYDILRWVGDKPVYLRRCKYGREIWPEEKTWAYAFRVWDHDLTAEPLDRGEDAWVEVASWPPAAVAADDGDKIPAEFDRWKDPFYHGENVKTPRYIPADLLEYLTPLLEQGDTYDAIDRCIAFLLRYSVDYAADDAFGIWKEKVWSEDWEGITLADVSGYKADADNDGTEDVLALSCQGTGHFATLYFLQGLEGGDYEDSFRVPFNRGDWWACISWKGTRYLVSLAEANWVRRFTGLNIYLLSGGAVRDRVFLSVEPVNWRVTADSSQPGGEAAAEHLAAVGPEVWTEFAKIGEQHIGTAERRATAAETADLTDEWIHPEDFYMCDLNGDGVEARYSKSDGGSTATGRALNTSLELDDFNEDGLAQMVWFDRVGEENLLIRASNFGDMPVQLSAFRWAEAGWERIACATLECERKVTRYRWTQGENIDFPTADWSWAWNGE